MFPISVYKTALNTSLVGHYFLSPSFDPVILEVNDTFLELVALKREDLIGKKLFEAFAANPNDTYDTGIEKLKVSIQRAIETGEKDNLPLQRYPIKKILPDGTEFFEERFWRASNTPMFDEHGQLICISHQTSEVTGKVYADIALKKAEARYRSLIDSIDDGFCIIEVLFDVNNNPIDYLFHEVNPVFEAQTGMKESAGKTILEILPNVEQSWIDIFGNIAKAGKSIRFENEAKQLGRIFDVYAYPIDEPNENMVGVLFRDITHKKQHEESLRQSESRLRALINATAEVIYSVNPDWTEILLLEGRGFLKAAINSRKLWLNEYVPAADHELVLHAIAKAMTEKSKFELVHRVYLADGSVGWIDNQAIPMFDESGTITEWLGASNNITKRKLAEEGLLETVRQKDDFLAMLAHELRNPLSPIAAAAEILSFKKLGEEKIQQCSDIISRQVKHMTSLIDDLLDVSRVRKGLITLEQEKIDLTKIITHSAEQVKPLVESQKHQIFLKTPQQPIFVLGDQHRLIQVFTNILNNAAKYTPKGGRINLTLEAEGVFAKIVITDNGIGMDAELIKRAFELFTQATRTPDRSQGGLGIGLALVKSLVELHQGMVTITSQGIGKGSQVTVRLPRLETEVVDQSSAIRSNPMSSATTNRIAKVMVVDDNAANADMLATLLEMTGYKVVVEYDPLKALARSIIEMPSIFILDIGLPEMNGKELARRLRAQPETQHATLIALSGYSEDQELINAKEAGFDHYFVKPLDFKKFLALLNGNPP